MQNCQDLQTFPFASDSFPELFPYEAMAGEKISDTGESPSTESTEGFCLAALFYS